MRIVLMLLALTSTGCTGLRLHETRLPFAGSEDLQVSCETFPNGISEFQKQVADRYRAGWRVAAVGEEVTSYMVVSQSRPMLCMERRSVADAAPSKEPVKAPPPPTSDRSLPRPPPLAEAAKSTRKTQRGSDRHADA